MDGTGTMMDKLKKHPNHKSRSQKELQKLAFELTNLAEIKSKFDHLLRVGNEMALEMADEDDDDLLHTMEMRAQHQRVKHDTARACHLPVQLCLQKLQVPTLPGAYTFSSLLKFEYGPLHAAVIVGDMTIEWGRESTVEPRFNPIPEAEFKANVGDQSEWLQLQGKYQMEMSLADRQRNSEEKLKILCESMAEKSQMIERLVDVIVDYNKNKNYSVFNCNCQDFVRDAMAALGIKKPVKFRGRLQSHFDQLKTGNVKVPSELHTHENIDLYVAANIQELEKQDMEYVQCLYFKAHLPAIEKSDDPDEWVCDIPTCKSAELDRLIGQRAIPFNQFLDTDRKDVNRLPVLDEEESKQSRDKPSHYLGTRERSHCHGSRTQERPQVSIYHPPPIGQDQPVGGIDIEHPRCINDCGMYGDPYTAGLCSQCFRKEQQALKEKEKADKDKGQQHIGMPVGPDTFVPNVQRASVQNLPRDPLPAERKTGCRTPGCEFFGTCETGFYCSQCFEADMENILKQIENPTPVVSHIHLPSAALIQEQGSSRYRAEPQISQHEHEPKKCYNCREFFANEDYLGLCHSCFMEKTKEGKDCHEMNSPMVDIIQPVHTHYPSIRQQPHIPRYEKCENLDCQGPRTENGYCDNCNLAQKSNSQQPKIYSESVTQQDPYRSPPLVHARFCSPTLSNLPLRAQGGQIHTKPVAHVNDTKNSTDDQCFLCVEIEVTRKNFVCQHHAESMKEMLFHSEVAKGEPNYPRHAQSQGSSMTSGAQPRQKLIRCSNSQQHPVERVLLPSTPAGPAEPYTNVTIAGVSADPQNPSNVMMRKQLCATPGCSFRWYKEIDNLCPDCYEYANPGRKAPDHLPLV